ncbi:hypothetical protein [Nostoc sp. ChiVER01]|nr:hypothetical protein [Nostoc sp. ChiVER01]MDZ8228041.1 hypothetical protein [Nostoc sp. ChiVER01]
MKAPILSRKARNFRSFTSIQMRIDATAIALNFNTVVDYWEQPTRFCEVR